MVVFPDPLGPIRATIRPLLHPKIEVEDPGLFFEALGQFVGDYRGIGRHGRCLLPVAAVSQPQYILAFRHSGGRVRDPDAKEAVLARTGVIWTIVGVLLIIALLIYIL